MSNFICPHCEASHDIGDYPDHVNEAKNNKFWFDCECGAEFQCDIDWSPLIWPIKDTVRFPEPDPDILREERDKREALRESEG
jgi:hypothetical protein